MTEKKKLDCGCRFDIIDLEILENHETIDRVRETSTGFMEWEGTIEAPEGKFKFKYEKSWEEGFGGEGAEIVSEKPKGMSDDEWDDLEQEMVDFIENDYKANRKEWEELE